MISSKKCPQKAIIFARVSTKEQENGHSLDAQIQSGRKYATEKHFEVIKEFVLIESLSSGDKKFFELINFIKKQKEPVALIVYSTDRLQRVFKEMVILDELIKLGKIEIHCIQNGLIEHKDMNSSQKFRQSLNILLSKDCSKRISERTKQAIQGKLEKGECVGRAPFGYKYIPLAGSKKKIVICPVNSAVVMEIFNLYSAEFNSIGRLARMFELSFPAVSKMLTNPFYYGEMRIKSHKTLYPHNYDKLISKRLFDECQKVRKNRKNT